MLRRRCLCWGGEGGGRGGCHRAQVLPRMVVVCNGASCLYTGTCSSRGLFVAALMLRLLVGASLHARAARGSVGARRLQ